MTKHEFPPFNMIIENGRLVPATPYDAERLDSFRRGTKVKVRFTEEKDRVLVRKWWAVLGLVVKQCDVPWKTKEEASEAVKLALGIVNLTKTVKNDRTKGFQKGQAFQCHLSHVKTSMGQFSGSRRSLFDLASD